MKRIILLVEDNIETLNLAKKALLNTEKCRDVIIAKDYDEAIEFLKMMDIDFVATDLFFLKKTGSGEITLGFDLLNQAEKSNQQPNLQTNLTAWLRSNRIGDLQQNIEEEHLQPLGILIAKL